MFLILTSGMKTSRQKYLRKRRHLVTSKSPYTAECMRHSTFILMMPEQMNVVPTYKLSGPSSLCVLR